MKDFLGNNFKKIENKVSIEQKFETSGKQISEKPNWKNVTSR